MKILFYNEIKLSKIPMLDKIIGFLENDDLRSADVKKVGGNLYRARLNKADRLLFSLYKTNQQTYALILEHIKNHAYEKSRFLRRGVKVNEELIPSIEKIETNTLDSLPHIGQQTSRFHLLHKPIAFDKAQQYVYDLPAPMIIIGTAGSGKTLLLLEKMKRLRGKVLYITQSPFLVNHSQNLYFANQFNGKQQSVAFLSFQDFLDSIAVQSGQSMNLIDFKQWFSKHLNSTPLKDGHALFEEFRGVITGNSINKPFLSKAEYLSLGVKESIFVDNQRADVYELFVRYLGYLKQHNRYEQNLVSYDYLTLPKNLYDYIAVDEVQDISPIQLHLIISSLTHPKNFILCGDANQIVYPNFFSWAKIKSLFLQQNSKHSTPITQILTTNYRNSDGITDVANKVLRIKNWRFGSIDRESHHEMQTLKVNSNIQNKGEQLVFLSTHKQTLRDIDQKTHASKNFAVIVLYDALKKEAATFFQTPLIFSVQECKGLEYENIILFNIVSSASENYTEICEGVTPDVISKPIPYARNKDKTDKSLEKYKFFINALFVAITRAQTNLYWIEDQAEHPFLKLFHHGRSHHSVDDLQHQSSKPEEWQDEVHKLEKQGKTEQAQRIREHILQQQTPSWLVIAGGEIEQLFTSALQMNDKKAKLSLFEYALVYEDHHARNALIDIDFAPAFHPEDGKKQLLIKHFMMYQQEQLEAIKRQIVKYGVDFRNPFNQTSLMIGAWLGSEKVIQLALTLHADTYLANNKGFNAFQIAIEQACLHSFYADSKLPFVYTLLRPETLSVRINNQLFKLGHQQVEFFLVNLMVALFYRVLPENMVITNGAFTANNLVEAIKHWPEGILPDSFHDAVYINKILESHQLSQTTAHDNITNNAHADLPLFILISPDNYLLNPNMMLQVEGEWLYIYDILLLDDLAINYQRPTDSFDTHTIFKNLLVEKIQEYKYFLNL